MSAAVNTDPADGGGGGRRARRTPLGRRKMPYWLVALLLVVVCAAAGTTYWAVTRLGRTNVTAFFDTSIGVSAGTDVRILGVTVGAVDEVIPRGDTVEVHMHVDKGVKVPADAKAAQVTPSVVPDRTIQLLPAYSGGPEMEDGAVIPRERTTTPVEIDRIYASVEQLTKALGPEGANKNGSVNTLLEASSRTLGDNGVALGRSIDELSKAATTLADSRQNISDTVVNLQSFVTMLRNNDQQVRQFNTQMGTFNRTLANQRHDLQTSLHELSFALADVSRLVRDNQDLIKRNADRLSTISGITAQQKDQLVEIVQTAPLALTNLIEAYDAENGSLSMRTNLPELQNPASVLCKLMYLGRLNPGNPQRKGREDPRGIAACEAAEGERNKQLQQAVPDLPLGILKGEMQQSVPVDGTVPGVPGYNAPPASERGTR